MQARSAGAVEAEAQASTGYEILGGPSGGTITSVTLTPSLPSSQAAGTTITWTAVAQGTVTPVLYRFWIQPWATGEWTVVQDWSASPTFAWTPTLAGGYNVAVQARRNTGSSVEAETAAGYAITGGSSGGTAISGVTLTPSVAPAQPVGTTITLTAAAQGPTSGVLYRFWIQPWATGVWQVVQDWSSTSTFAWTPTVAGGYNVAVDARRNTGSSVEAQAALGYVILPSAP